MKKPFIKNWIKYSASTLAISGMLVLGACGDSNENAETETAQTEVAAPVRENVADVETEVEEEETEVVAVQNEEMETPATSRSNDLGATFIRDMDAFLEEHQEVNQQITQVLTNIEGNTDAARTPETTNTTE